MLRCAIAVAVLSCVLMAGCSGGAIPDIRDGDECSIARLKELYAHGPQRIDRDISIKGVVVSDGQFGNFRKRLVVEDATGGIEIKVDIEDMSQFPWLGRAREVKVRCNGLYAAAYGGVVQLGAKPTGQWPTDLIAAQDVISYVQPVDETEHVLAPQSLCYEDFSMRYVNCWVRVTGVQFIDEEYRGLWGDPAQDLDRHLVNGQCDTIPVRVQGGSRFRAERLPQGSGHIDGVLQYFAGEWSLHPASAADNSMTGPRFAI